MRLLNTRTLQLEEFGDGGDASIPPYSILSHRWGREEVDFQGMQSEQRHHLEGFQKLARFCALSREEGYWYGWMDTCCIDKSSSAELSEAINSMFRWYQDASICYAYLNDVTDPPCADQASIDASFRRSQWFERGWTLQELVAPDSVVFLNSEWQEMGTRTTLGPLLHSITGIHGELFKPSIRRGYGLSALLRRYSIAQKLSWASRRKTTRVEDQAYCLMGLLDVNMPLLYGEGEKAFLRLQQVVMNQSDDASIFVWHNPTVAGARPQRHLVTGLLAGSPRCFVHAQNVESSTISCSKVPAGGPTPLHCYEVSKTSVIMRVPILDEKVVGTTPGSSNNDKNLGLLRPLYDRLVFVVLDCRDAESGWRIVLPLLDIVSGGARVLYRYQVGKTLYHTGEDSSLPARKSIAAYMGTDPRFIEYSRGGAIGDLVPRGLNLVTVRVHVPLGSCYIRQVGGEGWVWGMKDESVACSTVAVELWEATFGMRDSTLGWIMFDRRGASHHRPFAFVCHPQPGGHMRFTLGTLISGQSDELADAAAVTRWGMHHSEEKSEKRLTLPDGLEAVVKARVGAATCSFLVLVSAMGVTTAGTTT
ncbi:hypothetical protein MAPG_01323 [Magnaporthiopsis poae ATCC 64411]|uniref:Heterokaryon incompatibility domain-containing protein n=1 Tax=Magnaporthiopsis poae (strain ATCC 64411 / 73-15) TaxID=644358 RepID=A0A0C4DNE2_MAGP6|nr:hypothetical protein MAPG_01323 [Magnaporthiopsis poae ATCC 64411]